MLPFTAQVWLSEDETGDVLRQVFGAPPFTRSRLELNTGGLDSAKTHYSEQSTPDLLIIDADPTINNEVLVMQLDSLAEVCDVGTKLMIIGHSNDIELYKILKDRGVTDYLVKPIDSKTIRQAISSIINQSSNVSGSKCFSFIGCRGGVGSSTIAHNVAWWIGNQHKEEVCIIDLDIKFGTVGLAFNIESQTGIKQILGDPDRLDEQLIERFLYEYNEFIKVLILQDDLEVEEQQYSQAFERLLSLVQANFKFVVLDIPRIWQNWSRDILVNSDEIVLTSQPNLACLRDTRKVNNWLRDNRSETLRTKIVLNFKGLNRKTEISMANFEETIDQRPDFIIDYDPVIFGRAANDGIMAAEVNEKNRGVQSLKTLATDLSGGTGSSEGTGGSLFKKLFKRK